MRAGQDWWADIDQELLACFGPDGLASVGEVAGWFRRLSSGTPSRWPASASAT